MSSAKAGWIKEASALLRSKRFSEALSKLQTRDPEGLRGVAFGEYCLLVSECGLYLGDYSVLRLDEAIAAFRVKGSSERYAKAKYLKGWHLTALGRHAESHEALLESYAAYLRCDDMIGAARVLNRLAFVSVHIGNLDSAIQNLDRCAALYKRISDKLNETRVRMNMAYLLHVSGNLSDSLSIYAQIRPSIPGQDERNRSVYFSMSSLPYAARAETALARETIAQAEPHIAHYARERAIYFENLGRIELLDGQYAAAEKTLKSGLEISLRIAPESSLVSQIKRLLGDVYIAIGDVSQAEKFGQEALEVAEKVGEKIEIAACRRIFAQVQQRRGNTDKARHWFKKAIGLFNQLGTRYELAVTRYLAGTSGLYSNGEQKALLYLAREYFELEEVRPYIEKIDTALRTQPAPAPRVKRPSVASEPVIITRDAAMLKHLALARNVAESDMTVLLTGETGTGKDLLARYIHYHSGRSGEYVSVNAAAIPGEMVESELFGFAEGAFTGATRNRAGLVEQAHRGTLLLNEIADSSPQLQVKLLEVLETRCSRRLGENRSRKVDFRLIAATNQDLAGCVRDNRFRADLYHRLNEVHIHLPPLRDRMDDIRALLQHFLTFVGYDLTAGGSPADMQRLAELLSRHHWPGNVRELQSTVRRLWVTSKGDPGRMLALAEQSYQADDAELLLTVLEQTSWNRTEAARRLGVSEGTVRRRIKQFGLIQRASAE